MRNSNLLKWAQNNNSNTKQSTKGNRNWMHQPDSLQKGHIAYLVKFLGSTEVEQPKGIEVVKEGIRKLKFNQQLRKSEGNKIPKVELTISIDGVAIQEPKTKRIMHQYPLHRISYCADDKGEKRFFSFIAKEEDSERHICFVFVSDKLAEEITLTIGQAFDLAYKRFLDTSGKDLEVQRRMIILQQRVKTLENENSTLRQRLTDVSQLCPQNYVDEYLSRNNLPDLLTVENANSSCSTVESSDSSSYSDPTNRENGTLLNFSSSSTDSSNGFSSSGITHAPPVPPRAFEANKPFGDNDFISDLIPSQPSVGTKLEGLLLDEIDEDFNPRAYEQSNNINNSNNNNTSANPFPIVNGSRSSSPPMLAPPPKFPRETSKRPQNGVSANPFREDLFGSTPFNPPPTQAQSAGDPFGMGQFGVQSSQELESAIGILDKRILEMKDGFSRGLTFGNEDFSIESLDPLRN